MQENSQEQRPTEAAQASGLDRNQKTALAILVIFALVIIILWMVQFKKNLTEPFKAPKETAGLSATSTEDQKNESLKLKDTDGDGVSDWDELNIYHSSPYLEDTDSDGIADGEEIKKGTDPTCPEGHDCSGNIKPATTTPVSAGGTQATTSQQLPLNLKGNQGDQDLQKLVGGGMDAAGLRQTLLDSGMDPKLLNQLTDKQILDSYQQTLKGEGSAN